MVAEDRRQYREPGEPVRGRIAPAHTRAARAADDKDCEEEAGRRDRHAAPVMSGAPCRRVDSAAGMDENCPERQPASHAHGSRAEVMRRRICERSSRPPAVAKTVEMEPITP